MKSQGERRVGDWLSLHGIRWQYETRYPDAPSNAEKKDYTPDFYLPDHEVWLEVWSCDRQGNLPSHYIGEKYLHEMEWKRSLHRQMGTRLVEIFQDAFRAGRLSDALQSRLWDADVEPPGLTSEQREALFHSVAARDRSRCLRRTGERPAPRPLQPRAGQ